MKPSCNFYELSQTGLIKEANFLKSTNFNKRPKDTLINLVVIHSISLPPNEFGGAFIEDFFTNKLKLESHPYFNKIKGLKVSPHFLIKRNGELIQFVSCKDRAWHAGESNWKNKSNCNDFSIGIELEGSDLAPFENIQYMKLINLLKCLFDNYPINAIVGHNQIAPERKTDPGPFFDWKLINAENFHD
ncbi:1,6-anhydro-N-acetylmuramyl-L-alanine amidase AmpD [Methylophilaceae bacterium]|jgi:AmpD protein|nr:1,6-anhydro-N-acetylmuramyl-L-alanine amidase AmpD [Methylophilaceae bacterium]|tara:strand:+ start:113 stop:676 length:564 start_codon:yes stop_codon:yes gene_type:complete